MKDLITGSAGFVGPYLKKNSEMDVVLIMKEIQTRAKKRAVNNDVDKLNSINLKNLSVEDVDSNEEKNRMFVVGEESCQADDLMYINSYYSLGDKYNFVNTHRKGLVGRFANNILGKLFLAMKIFINKIVLAQEGFNFKVVALFNRFSKTLAKQDLRINNFAIQMEEKTGDLALQVSKQKEKIKNVKKDILYPNLNINYKDFEDRFRGDQEEILRRQVQYSRFFSECNNVMDIGCGRGEFIDLLHSNGIGAFGVENDSMMVKECLKKDLNVVDIDVVSYLRQQLNCENPDFIDGVFSAQVVEHLHMDYIVEMLKLCYELLQKGKFIVLETINIKSLSTFTNSVYLDPTHVKPIHPETLKFLLESVGFKFEGFIFSSEFKDHEKLIVVEEKTPQDKIYNQNIERLNELLFAPQDYAVVAKK